MTVAVVLFLLRFPPSVRMVQGVEERVEEAVPSGLSWRRGCEEGSGKSQAGLARWPG